MSAPRVFDQAHYDRLNASRGAIVSSLLLDLKQPLGLKTAIDVGCGLGHFSGLLRSQEFDVTAVDGRAENAEEAARRYPGIKFHTCNVEDPELRKFGKFDLVFCFGLLYHLENPLLAIRNLHAIAGKLLLVEGVIFPGDAPTMGLMDEGAFDDQGLNHLAFYPTEACLAKMFYRAGFPFVYRTSPLPDHPEYRTTNGLPRVRTMLAASFTDLPSKQLQHLPEPSASFLPWDPASVAASPSSVTRWSQDASRFVRQKFWLPLLDFTRPVRHALGLKAENARVRSDR